jgi:diaminopimelate epimerase
MQTRVEVIRTIAAGNSFFIIPNFQKNKISKSVKLKLIRSLSKLQKTDGCVFLHSTSGADFEWDFYNSDGSSADMCGNACRVVAFYFFSKIKPKRRITFKTSVGVVQVDMKEPKLPLVRMPYSMKLLKFNGAILKLNSGVPHCIFWGDPQKNLAQKVRKTENANVTFVKRSRKGWNAVTYERGVENFTSACGTGAIAAAWAIKQFIKKQKPIEIKMPGGKLTVQFLTKNDIPFLKGPAKIEKTILL